MSYHLHILDDSFLIDIPSVYNIRGLHDGMWERVGEESEGSGREGREQQCCASYPCIRAPKIRSWKMDATLVNKGRDRMGKSRYILLGIDKCLKISQNY
jgi:hypothetical protein